VSVSAARGHNPAGVITEREYELRSRGPASLSNTALDNLVSTSRRSFRSTADVSPPTAPPTAPPPSPPTSVASPSVYPAMANEEPSLADVVRMLQTLSADVVGLKAKAASSSEADSRPDGQHHTDRPPRFQKLDFPRYDGKTDPLLFIIRCESYFRQQRTMPEEKVWMASYNLEDIAQFWFMQLQEDEGTPPWGRFKELLNLRFGPAMRSAPLFELSECRRTGIVEEYSNRFQALLPCAGRLDQEQRVQLYTGGLLPPLSHQVRVHAPASLEAAMSLARQLELMELDRLNQAAPRAAARTFSPAPAPRQAALVLPVPAQPALAAPKAPLALPAPLTREGGQATKRLSVEEQAERRRLGLCYNCNEPYSRGHNRVCRRIFFIDGFELAEAEASEEAPVFSLHAVAGCLSPAPSNSACMWGRQPSPRSSTPAPHTASSGRLRPSARGCPFRRALA
jgi:hypothetical protein